MTSPDDRLLLARRMRLLAVLIGAPAILAATTLTVLEGWRLSRPQSELFVTPFAYSLAEAIERDDVRRAYAFIRAGQDPNEPIAVRHRSLTADRVVQVSPLVWAVAVNSRSSVLLLLGFGARMDRAPEDRAACLAKALGNSGMAELLRRYGDAGAITCPDSSLAVSPVLSFLRN